MPAGSSSPAARAIDKALAVVGLPNDLAVLLLVVVAGLLVKASFATAAMYYVGSQLAEVAARLRLDLIDRVLNARWSYYIRQPVGRFANAISGEVARAAEAYISVATLISLLIQVTSIRFSRCWWTGG